MNVIAVLPARYASTRFPGKPLADINGKPMIWRVYERVSGVAEIDKVYVATDDKRIYDAVDSFGGNVIMTSDKHTCGTDRIAECLEKLPLADDDVVLNIQGDEPLINKESIRELVQLFDDNNVYMGTLKKRIDIEEEFENSNVVKVITDINGDAIYFSRFCVPFVRGSDEVPHFKHIGVYGYRSWFLKKISKMKKTPLERAESLEQLRVLENGFKIKVAETKHQTIGVDTPEQLEIVRKMYEEL